MPDDLILSEYPLLDIDNFIVIDTETTGMTADDEVIELAVVDMDGTVLYDSTFCPVTEVIVNVIYILSHIFFSPFS